MSFPSGRVYFMLMGIVTCIGISFIHRFSAGGYNTRTIDKVRESTQT